MQELNPHVVAMWIRHELSRRPANADDAILDVLVWGTHMPIDPRQYGPDVRAAIERHLRRATAYNSNRAVPPDLEMRMVYAARGRYERRLVATSPDEPRAPAQAESYVTELRPCYEWEGMSDCPEREARFADEYQAASPNGPFRDYLPLLSAHRWLCAAEGYDRENEPEAAERSRDLYRQRVDIARQSEVLLIRVAAERLAGRGRCQARTDTPVLMGVAEQFVEATQFRARRRRLRLA